MSSYLLDKSNIVRIIFITYFINVALCLYGHYFLIAPHFTISYFIVLSYNSSICCKSTVVFVCSIEMPYIEETFLFHLLIKRNGKIYLHN